MKNKIIGVTPFVSLFIFMVIGLSTGVWHPTWLVFMLVPIVGAFLGASNTRDGIMGGSTLVITTLFLSLSLIFGLPWHISAMSFIFVGVVAVILYT